MFESIALHYAKNSKFEILLHQSSNWQSYHDAENDLIYPVCFTDLNVKLPVCRKSLYLQIVFLYIGTPSESNIYSDISAAWHALRTRYNVKPEEVIIYGQSIGTVPTIDLATRVNFAGVVLHSPLLSGMRVAFPETNRTWCFDPFPR